jgi:hypothetical protein
MSEKSLAIHKEQAEKIRQAALSSNLDQAAKELGLTVQETKPFARGQHSRYRQQPSTQQACV